MNVSIVVEAGVRILSGMESGARPFIDVDYGSVPTNYC